MNGDKYFRLITHKKVTVNISKHIVQFSFSGSIIRCPKRLGVKILSAIKKSNYKLVREMIDMYKDLFVSNLS